MKRCLYLFCWMPRWFWQGHAVVGHFEVLHRGLLRWNQNARSSSAPNKVHSPLATRSKLVQTLALSKNTVALCSRDHQDSECCSDDSERKVLLMQLLVYVSRILRPLLAFHHGHEGAACCLLDRSLYGQSVVLLCEELL